MSSKELSVFLHKKIGGQVKVWECGDGCGCGFVLAYGFANKFDKKGLWFCINFVVDEKTDLPVVLNVVRPEMYSLVFERGPHPECAEVMEAVHAEKKFDA